jgi:hypothetical protein
VTRAAKFGAEDNALNRALWLTVLMACGTTRHSPIIAITANAAFAERDGRWTPAAMA